MILPHAELKIPTLSRETKEALREQGKTMIFYIYTTGEWFTRKIKNPHSSWGQKTIRTICKDRLDRGQGVLAEYLDG